MPVLIDSGFRRGTDIVKALCMGAKGVAVGRPYLWGLGAFGQPGVERVLDILRTELMVAMQQVGAPSLKDLKPSMVAARLSATMMKQTSCRDRLEQALARIADPKGEGARACLTVYARRGARRGRCRRCAGGAWRLARAARRHHRQHQGSVRCRRRADPRRLENSRRGSGAGKSRRSVVQRLRAAGAVIVAKTNMTEFAFSGIGANPHFGTPGNPRDRARVPGGSSAGAPVARRRRHVRIAIGTDTGGSVRIPAALAAWSASSRAGSACRPTARFR